MKNWTTTEVEAKRDKMYKLLKNRNSTRHALRIRESYDRCVEELIRRGFNAQQAKT